MEVDVPQSKNTPSKSVPKSGPVLKPKLRIGNAYDLSKITALCDVVVSSDNAAERQKTALYLCKHFTERSNWRLVPIGHQEQIRDSMLNALMNEETKSIRDTIVQFVANVIRYNASTEWMAHVVRPVLERCSSSDSIQCEMDLSILVTLAEIAPAQFWPQSESVREMLAAKLAMAEQCGDLCTPETLNIFEAMCTFMPYIPYNRNYEIFRKISKALEGFATQDEKQFRRAFDVMEKLADRLPQMLKTDLRSLVDFCFALAANAEFGNTVHMRALTYISRLVYKKENIMSQKLVGPIIMEFFFWLEMDPEEEIEDNSENINCFLEPQEASIRTVAMRTIKRLMSYIPPAKLLTLLESAFDCPLYKKGAYFSFADMATGCSEPICREKLRPLLDRCKVGIAEENSSVRLYAFSALIKFCENLQPEIGKHADEILPILIQLLKNVCDGVRLGNSEPKYIPGMFCVLNIFYAKMKEAILPYLPTLLECLLETMNSTKLCSLSLLSVGLLAKATKNNMLPYLSQLFGAMKILVIKTDMHSLLINTLTTLVDNIGGKENLIPFANDVMVLVRVALDNMADSKASRISQYNLLISLSEIPSIEMAAFLPKLVPRMLNSVNEWDTEYSHVNGCDERDRAIQALESMAECTGTAFKPYFEQCIAAISEHLYHYDIYIRQISVEALTQFLISLFRLNDTVGLRSAINMVIPSFDDKMEERIYEDDVFVKIVLEAYLKLFKTMKSELIFNKTLKDRIFNTVSEVMSFYGEDSSQDHELINDIWYEFGEAMQPSEFAPYFDSLLPIINKSMEIAQNDEDDGCHRSHLYSMLSTSFDALQGYTGKRFDDVLPLFIAGLHDEFNEARQNAVYGLGELVFYAGEKAFDKYELILQAFSEMISKEEDAGVLDNVLGAIARLIMGNSRLVPLEQVLPVLVQKLPLREDYHEYKTVFKGFHVLLAQNNDVLLQLLGRIILIGFGVLARNEYKDKKTRKIIVGFLKDSRVRYADVFDRAVASAPEAAQLIQIL